MLSTSFNSCLHRRACQGTASQGPWSLAAASFSSIVLISTLSTLAWLSLAFRMCCGGSDNQDALQGPCFVRHCGLRAAASGLRMHVSCVYLAVAYCALGHLTVKVDLCPKLPLLGVCHFNVPILSEHPSSPLERRDPHVSVFWNCGGCCGYEHASSCFCGW